MITTSLELSKRLKEVMKDDFNYTAFIQVIVKPHRRGCRKAKEYERIMQLVILDTFNDLRPIEKFKIRLSVTSGLPF